MATKPATASLNCFAPIPTSFTLRVVHGFGQTCGFATRVPAGMVRCWIADLQPIPYLWQVTCGFSTRSHARRRCVFALCLPSQFKGKWLTLSLPPPSLTISHPVPSQLACAVSHLAPSCSCHLAVPPPTSSPPWAVSPPWATSPAPSCPCCLKAALAHVASCAASHAVSHTRCPHAASRVHGKLYLIIM